ncbi:patatin-like phospholipase family protein [Methylobacterium sp. 17Sr1-1]|uniref:patatin-like phospholipase family protein n=1 Tax=Methylobacterium sp. 17Sr1-1 TaxID=2202826 RepID=UPI000D6F5FD7|nr:patatin-like phospholipase family protein [Methylobacterium sp. 17Sr1-1]AWN51127.1 hypothetical protein DK412_04920 [Methylobacterium sp. 17Sr1-1]
MVGQVWFRILALVRCWWQEPIGIVVPLLAAAIVLFAPQMPDMWVALQNEQSGVWAPLKFGLAAALLGFTSWYWTRAALFARIDQDDYFTAEHWRSLDSHATSGKTIDIFAASWARKWAPRLSVLVVGIIALLPAIWVDRSSAAAITGAPLLGIAGGAVGVLFVTLLTTLREWRRWYYGVRAPRWMWCIRTSSIFAAAPFGWPVAVACLAASLGASFVLGMWPQWVQKFFPAPVAALCALAFVVGPLVLVLGFIRDVLHLLLRLMFWAECKLTRRKFSKPPRRILEPLRDGLGPFILLIWLYANPFGANLTAYHVRLVDHLGQKQACAGQDSRPSMIVDCRPDLSGALEAWSTARFPDWKRDKPIPVVIVAAEGGASRAAAWLLAAMRYLQDRTDQEFDRYLFAISGVSGGSLGAATYLQAAVTYGETGGVLNWRNNPKAYKGATQLAGEDLLAESVATYFINDVFGRLIGSVWPFDDRAVVLEHTFERFWADPRGLDVGREQAVAGFLDLYGRKKGLPQLILNGTDRQTGQRLITATFRFSDGDDIFAGSDDFLYVLGHDVPIATAVTNSARFPYISPAGHFRRLRPSADFGDNAVLDGGYFDNYGARTASELARAIARNPLYRPIVVVISNDADGIRKTDSPKKGDKAPYVWQSAIHCRKSIPLTPEQAVLNNRAIGHNVFEFLAPIVGLAAIRGSHSRDALYILQRELCDATYDGPTSDSSRRPDRFFHIALSRPTNEREAAPMNWVLNDRARHFLTETAFRPEPEDFNNQQIAGLLKTINEIKINKLLKEPDTNGR